MNEVQTIESKILTIRGQQVMLDRDLAELYGVETRVLNQAVKRNAERFPERFMFQLTQEESAFLMSQNVISNETDSSRSQIVTLNRNDNLMSQIVISSWGGTRKLPYAFTEQGVSMLSVVLKSETAVQVSIRIMDAFVAMRHFLLANEKVFVEIDSIKKHLIESDIHQKETDKRVDELFDKMDRYAIEDKQGIFFQGQIFDIMERY